MDSPARQNLGLSLPPIFGQKAEGNALVGLGVVLTMRPPAPLIPVAALRRLRVIIPINSCIYSGCFTTKNGDEWLTFLFHESQVGSYSK